MKDILLTILRDKNTKISEFRRAAEKLGLALASEVLQHIEKKKVEVKTPLDKSEGYKIKNEVVFIPILRAALSLLPPFLKFFENAKVGFIGLKRDEVTAIPEMYYSNLPKINPIDDVIILDPMIATGGSGSKTIKILKEAGVKEEKIIFVAIICSSEGINKIRKEFPKIKLMYVQEDKILNKDSFIIPGLGDFGDRFFGTL